MPSPATPSLLIFARAPRPGHTKTRLIPALGPDAAATLYAAFLDDTLATARTVGADVHLVAASPADAEVLTSRHPGTPIRTQPDDPDLGARMHAALAAALADHDRAVLIGSDAPTLPAHHLAAAFAALDTADAVLGPTHDGGFILVGARGAAPSFGDARWSTRHALADTLAAFRRQQRATRTLRPWYDVDTPDDLALLRAHLSIRPRSAPATAAALALAFDRSPQRG